MSKLQWFITKDSYAINSAREILLTKGLRFAGTSVYALQITYQAQESDTISESRKLFSIAYKMKRHEGFQPVEKFTMLTYNPETGHAEYVTMAIFVLDVETCRIH